MCDMEIALNSVLTNFFIFFVQSVRLTSIMKKMNKRDKYDSKPSGVPDMVKLNL